MTILPYIALMRPAQWVKNLLVFAPPFFAGALLSPGTLTSAALAFVAFSFAASAVYMVNDVVDREADAAHPRKRHRPIPSGRASVRISGIVAAGLAIAALLIAMVSAPLLIIVACYLVANAAYSLVLKHIAVVDVVLVALFYVLRVVAGGVATSITLSPWIILATFFLALFLVVGKRRGEFERPGRRAALDGYRKEALDALLGISAALALTFYGLWAVLVHPSTLAVYTVIPVAAALLRTVNLIYHDPEAAESPERSVFREPWILALATLWGVSMVALFYLAP